MNIYVDPLYPTPRTNRWSREHAAHLFCLPGGEEILRQFGKLMGLPEERYRPMDVVPHWELTEEDHASAIAAGAKPVTRAGMEEAVRIWRAHRAAEPQDGRKRRGKKR
jgi:Na+-translocating ferredoxin:NAD+ oxidoreductase RNF subunit RnfB